MIFIFSTFDLQRHCKLYETQYGFLTIQTHKKVHCSINKTVKGKAEKKHACCVPFLMANSSEVFTLLTILTTVTDQLHSHRTDRQTTYSEASKDPAYSTDSFGQFHTGCIQVSVVFPPKDHLPERYLDSPAKTVFAAAFLPSTVIIIDSSLSGRDAQDSGSLS